MQPLGNSEQLKQVIAEIRNAPTVEGVPVETLNLIRDALIFNRHNKQLDKLVRKDELDTYAVKNNFLNTHTSERTQRVYKMHIEAFLKWSDKSVIDIDRLDCESYVQLLNNQYIRDKEKDGEIGKPSTVKIKVAAISSFFSYLVRHQIIPFNPFEGIKLNKVETATKGSGDIPTDKEIDTILQALKDEMKYVGKGMVGKRRSARNIYAALTVILHCGVRIGALTTLTIDGANFKAKSKGGLIEGKIPKQVISVLKELKFNPYKPFADIKTKTLEKEIERFMIRSRREGILKTVFSWHDFRHYFAVKFWNENKDIYMLMNALGQKSINTTQIYLASLRIKI